MFFAFSTIISWNLDHKPERKPSPLPYAISAAVGLITGVFLYFQQVPLTSTLLIALAVLFELLGWWLLAQKRVQSKRKEMPDFLLSHMGLIFHEKISVFNGYNKGITQVDVKDGILALTIKNRRQEYTLQLDIPEEKAEDVRSFITDMNDYFNGDAHAEE